MNPLQQLRSFGQSFWLDYMRRTLLTSGELDRLIRADDLAGMTSNPTIFEKAIAEHSDYDDALRALIAEDPERPVADVFEALALEDIRRAADRLRPVYDAAGGGDGFVSYEVSPLLAHDTDATIREARRLFQALARPNVMIKVPATSEGVPAIEMLTAAGVNVNVTLIFSLAQYEQVAEAFLRGLARAATPERLASVASFFVSRVDTAVDRALEARGTPEALALRGTIAVANARAAYRRFREIFHGDRFASFRARSLRVQRPLWGSTGTKNKAYSDVLYVEELIGPETVNTMPPATADAFREHGRPRASLEENLDQAPRALERLASLDIDLGTITARLLVDGVQAFADSYTTLMAALEKKRAHLRDRGTGRTLISPGPAGNAVTAQLETWQRDGFGRRLWARDTRLWSPTPVPELADRLGWLTLHEAPGHDVDAWLSFADEVRRDGVERVVLLGMGGSSLAPEVFQATFGAAPGRPSLLVLDSTHPDAVRAVDRQLPLDRTLFLVSSKSGTTVESQSFFRYFWARMAAAGAAPGRHFVAITDPGTPLERLAHERGFRRVFQGPTAVGGRYSALSVFGTVPAALIGVDVGTLLARAARMAAACGPSVPAASNPGLALGALLAQLTRSGHDKVTFFTSPRLDAFPAWLEQLIAESTGKGGAGIVPVADEPPGPAPVYGGDRLFVSLGMEGDAAAPGATGMDALSGAGFPTARIPLADVYDLGQEILRWEIAVASAGAALAIQPFNQPDVQLAKDLARQAMARGPARDAAVEGEVGGQEAEAVARRVRAFLQTAKGGDYLAIQAYLAPTAETTAALQSLRTATRNRTRLATTVGYGPRFLHSTGQLHKGGPNTVLVVQIVNEPEQDLQVPETDYTFGTLIRAQALGDHQALVGRSRRVLRVALGRGTDGLQRFADGWRAALD